MAADLYIHIYKGLTEDDMWLFFQNHIGSKWDEWSKLIAELEQKYGGFDAIPDDEMRKRYAKVEKQQETRMNKLKKKLKKEGINQWQKMAETPNIWVGEVSWLKAAFCEDNETFIPDAINKISDIIGEDLPVIDDDLINKIAEAMKLPNKTSYSLENAETVIAFLNQYRGEKVFTISW
jgi:hypothetical protein